MPLVRVKDKYQVTLPASLRRQANVEIGDVLEAEVKAGKITLTPKVVVERELARALQDLNDGKLYGPFKDADELLRSLHRNARKVRRKSSRRS